MKKLICLIFLTTCVNAVHSQPGTPVKDKIKFESWSAFHIENGVIFWQDTYLVPGVSQDSLRALIISQTRLERRFTLVNDAHDEITFDVIDKPLPKGGHIYKAKMIIEIKPEKYRLTLKSIEIRGSDPQSAIEGNKKYFRDVKLTYLTELSSMFSEAFDFRNHPSKNVIAKDW